MLSEIRERFESRYSVPALAGVTTEAQKLTVLASGGDAVSGAVVSQPNEVAGATATVSRFASYVAPPVSAQAVPPFTGVLPAVEQAQAETRLGLPKPVGFTPFKVRVWERGQGVLNSGDSWGGVREMNLVKGRYILRFTAPADAWVPFTEFQGQIETKVLGKKVIVEKAVLDKVNGIFTVQINIIQNPIPLLLLIPAAVVAVGGGVWWASEGVEQSLESVDRVLIDVTDQMWQWLLIGGLGLAAWAFVFAPMLRKG